MKDTNAFFNGAFFIIFISLFCASCSNAPEKKEEVPVAKDTPAVVVPVETKRAPIININDTLSIKRIVITMKDSASTHERVSMKLGEIYGVQLAAVISKNNLKVTGKPIAWYKSKTAPFFFEAGLPVDKRPSKAAPGVQVKEIGTDSVVIAHFYGPYDLTFQGYDVLKDLLKERKKKIKGAAYEIYVDDPFDSTGRPKDPYKVQTDIVIPYK
ncbi:MAG: hypothetical protein Q7T76_07230 [Ferruginibacter sp.]|nr:hypothetical protein [Ferruginibacter sp.]